MIEAEFILATKVIHLAAGYGLGLATWGVWLEYRGENDD